jgi:hypothetical protein
MESIQDVIRRLGRPDLVQQFPDDQALLQHLLLAQQQIPQLQQMARYGERVAGNWNEVEQFLAQRQQQQRQTAQEPWWKPLWNPPPYDPSWEKMIGRDAQGNYVGLPGAPPDIVNKYVAHQQFRTQTADKIMSNPFEFFEPAIKQLARQEAQAISQQQLAQHNDRQFSQSLIQQNADWICQKDQSGQPQFNRDGTPVLSPWGQAYAGYVRDAAQLGLVDPQKQHSYALGLTQRDYLLAQQNAGAQVQQPAAAVAPAAGAMQPQLTPAQQAQQNANNQFLNRAAGAQHHPQRGPQLVNGQVPANTVGLSLDERLRNNFKANGVTDRDIQAPRGAV